MLHLLIGEMLLPRLQFLLLLLLPLLLITSCAP
jgi:hypothetical protein